MKTIYMVCRSKKETPRELIRLESLFPECEVQIVYDAKPDRTMDSGVKSFLSSPHGSFTLRS
ncbi:MAG: hypothetical protein PHS17_08510 [Desulfobacterales bacterium]|nr:hypothetical protein [Desulfobacterales bacterium]